jgi:hypothetical protein
VTIYRLFFANSPAHDSGGRVDCVVGFWERSLLFDKKRRCIASTTTVVAAESVHGRHVCARGDGRRPFEPPAGVVVAIPARQTEPKIPYSTAMSVCGLTWFDHRPPTPPCMVSSLLPKPGADSLTSREVTS